MNHYHYKFNWLTKRTHYLHKAQSNERVRPCVCVCVCVCVWKSILS